MGKFNLHTELSEDFKIATQQAPASTADIFKLREFANIILPSDYEDLLLAATEVEIGIKNESYVRIWNVDGCFEMNEAYDIQGNLGDMSFAIGDNEGGSVLVYLSGHEGFGIYLVGFGDLDIDDAEFIAPSLSDLLKNSTGIDKLLF